MVRAETELLPGMELLMPARPILKWAGGKTQLLPELRRAIPRNFNRYAEPFLGAGAVLFDLARPGTLASDSNPDLIGFYEVVRDSPEELLDRVRSMPISSDDYYVIRAIQPEALSPIERAARFVYLNKTCYNGLYRVNKQGRFNTPYGGKQDVTVLDEWNLRRVTAIVSQTDLRCGDYRHTLSRLEPGDFVYLDPPYMPLGGYSDFRRYTSSFFGENDHVQLASEFSTLAGKGVFALLSNSANEAVSDLYRGYPMRRVKATRQINCKADRRGCVDELLIANYPLEP